MPPVPLAVLGFLPAERNNFQYSGAAGILSVIVYDRPAVFVRVQWASSCHGSIKNYLVNDCSSEQATNGKACCSRQIFIFGRKRTDFAFVADRRIKFFMFCKNAIRYEHIFHANVGGSRPSIAMETDFRFPALLYVTKPGGMTGIPIRLS